jgi:hypothetical protein
VESRGRVTRREWLWALAWSAAALAITCVPYLLGAALSSPDRVFGGFVIGVEDGYSYLAKMGEGARGAWLFHIVYTSEPHQGALFFLFHILLGKLSALVSGIRYWSLTETMVVVYHAARVLFGGLLLLTVYRFIALFTPSRAIRRLAFLIVAFSGGFGWLLLLLGQPNWLGSSPVDLLLPEGFTFLVLYGFPHIALGRTLLLVGFISLWGEFLEPQSHEERKEKLLKETLALFASWRLRPGWLLAGLCWLAMGLIVPFYVAVAWAIAGAAWLAVTLRRRAIAWDETLRMALACLIASPVVIYSLIIFTVNPVMRVWSEQNLILSPHPLHYIVGYALVGLLAVFGAVYVLRRRDERALRLVAWAVVVPPLLYLPFNLQRRLIEGWQVPLAVLAALGLTRFVLPAWRRTRFVRWLIRFPRYSVRGLRQWAITLILLAMVPTNILLIGSGTLAVIARRANLSRWRRGQSAGLVDHSRDVQRCGALILFRWQLSPGAGRRARLHRPGDRDGARRRKASGDETVLCCLHIGRVARAIPAARAHHLCLCHTGGQVLSWQYPFLIAGLSGRRVHRLSSSRWSVTGVSSESDKRQT